MSTLVSTGQITIVDNNDAKPITGYITSGSQPLQQVYSQNNGIGTYTPSRATTSLVLTAQVYVGTATNIASNLLNAKWCTSPGGTALTSVSGLTVTSTTLTISDDSQVTMANPSKTIYFEADYKDSVTGFLSHIVLQTTLSLVQTGTNATYPQFKGSMFIEQSTGSVKKQVEIVADLIRTSGIDTTNLYYRWYTLVSGTWTALDQTFSGYATKFGYRTASNTASDDLSTTVDRTSMLGVNVPAVMSSNTTIDGHKGIVIDESLISAIGLFKCSITDTLESLTYDGYFTVIDKSDPYQVTLISTSGEKLQNGVGNTNIYPVVYYGSSKVTNLTGWSFTWYYWAVDMNSISTNPTSYRAAFIDTTRTAVAAGRTISANTAGTSSTITYSGSPISFVNNDIIKVVLTSGITRYYEVSGGTNNGTDASTVTIRATATNSTWLNNGVMNTTPTLSELVNGYLFVGLGTRVTSGGNNSDTAAQINVTGYEIDVKGTILCEANRP